MISSEEQFGYDRLLAFEPHVAVLDPTIDLFCRRRGWVVPPKRAYMGVWPGRHLRKEGEGGYCIEISLAQRHEGRFYSEFAPDVPFYLDSGSWILNELILHSFPGPFIQKLIPFATLQEGLAGYLEEADRRLSLLTPEMIFRHGMRFDRGAPWDGKSVTEINLEERRLIFDKIVPRQ